MNTTTTADDAFALVSPAIYSAMANTGLRGDGVTMADYVAAAIESLEDLLDAAAGIL